MLRAFQQIPACSALVAHVVICRKARLYLPLPFWGRIVAISEKQNGGSVRKPHRISLIFFDSLRKYSLAVISIHRNAFEVFREVQLTWSQQTAVTRPKRPLSVYRDMNMASIAHYRQHRQRLSYRFRVKSQCSIPLVHFPILTIRSSPVLRVYKKCFEVFMVVFMRVASALPAGTYHGDCRQ